MSTVTKTIVVLPGDHVGTEITDEAIKVLNSISEARPNIKFEFQHHLIGGAAIDATGVPLPDESLEASKKADAVLLGAVGGPKWGTGAVRPEQGLLKIRKELGLYANLRPCNFASESLLELSPLKPEYARGTDFCVVRELVGGIYFGKRKEDDGDGVAWDSEQYSVPEVQRITRMAAFMALQHNPPLPIWSLDKANVLASSRLWRKTVEETIKNEFPTLTVQHQLIDSAAMILIKNPTKLNGLVITSNMFGDIISDEASVIPGSLGLLPSASLASLPDTNKAFGLYEPCHGSAPDLPKGKVNPIATILSVAMMLKLSLDMVEEGVAVEKAVKKVLDSGVRTGDLRGTNSTSEVGDAVAAAVKEFL
ncbi:similar to Saccharomyces cerevisiae YCL018W LEU2 Beta-isopropylmalate dehydrogenase (IMDH), catalyzes the third step in the leucine biosynthesis pathway [Maudiozyma barnettii]|uniref:3-isopropylmalate dehydrogenase n=1 Tax=Maudiozyma barnettii TaxID=61262 RepID=A0A8H2VJ16_9SACH|nr:3-isopropylmalate dehydrogenase [Kazachstania barnettii]CAB4256549.1 similar to Saccharomyces cerevisiae YCL018W LEU2 Beta-isopropylmalate dehydrogenase (IMDH), catalyzes the third step in the leucine biosynthesis pathway [Kazachstania barnettii]CAD1785152.1 similar to Saccharomyces cerevisiae YCL018W LEU2 Beta-isopropylmalate dehydrogenase (IMDH), catalyzes the third step in the leucine biosynthesis pathway [Kazachstania barnettii]